jgi:tRNA threonylcarbamoyladenosine biosynthesis protein TsaE
VKANVNQEVTAAGLPFFRKFEYNLPGMVVGRFAINQLHDAASRILRLSRELTVWTFEGDMGAGKTTLIKAICKTLGVTDTVTSPTFALMNEYNAIGKMKVYHFDFYRIKNLQEAESIGTSDYFYSGNYCLVEWPSLVKPLLPDSYLKISLKPDGENFRLIELESVYL